MTSLHCPVEPKWVQFFTSLSSPKVAMRGIFDQAFHYHLCTLNNPQTVYHQYQGKEEFIDKTGLFSIGFTKLPEPHNDYQRTPRNLGLPAIILHL